jgi:hypothetical protein
MIRAVQNIAISLYEQSKIKVYREDVEETDY